MRFLYVSVDPSRDSPDELARYLTRFDRGIDDVVVDAAALPELRRDWDLSLGPRIVRPTWELRHCDAEPDVSHRPPRHAAGGVSSAGGTTRELASDVRLLMSSSGAAPRDRSPTPHRG